MEHKHRMPGHWWPLAVLLLAGPACSQSGLAGTLAPRPVDDYRNSTQQQLARCSDAFRRSTRRLWLTQAGRDYQGCIGQARADTNAKLATAARVVRKADAQRALIAYHAAFLTALGGIVPRPDEIAEGYEQRQSLLLHLMSHAWSRYELVE